MVKLSTNHERILRSLNNSDKSFREISEITVICSSNLYRYLRFLIANNLIYYNGSSCLYSKVK